MKVILNNTIIGESMNTIIVEGNHYFPKDSLNMIFLQDQKLSRIVLGKEKRRIIPSKSMMIF